MTGIYVHIPFCIQKCKYCDFCSFPELIGNSDKYCEHVLREAESYAQDGIIADTLYFGGGTPSLLSAKQIATLTDGLGKVFGFESGSEFTLEANPCTITEEKAKLLRNSGINRISLGAQSFVDKELSVLGRAHSADDTLRAYDCVRSAGFDNVSLDLMYAIPGQSVQSLEKSIDTMLAMGPEHISCYGLKIEAGTPFGDMLKKGELTEASEDTYADMYELICSRLASGGYGQYELSNFARSGFESRHNIKYWLMEDYIGLGVAASSMYGGRRYTRTYDFEEYMSKCSTIEQYTPDTEDSMSEFMFLSLRLTREGASKEKFRTMFGRTIEDVFGDTIRKHLALGTIEDMGDRYVLAPSYYYTSNSILCDFVYCTN